MSKTRQARRIRSHAATSGLTRNAGVRQRADVDEQALEDRYLQLILLRGISTPFSKFAADHTLANPTMERFGVARDGQINELAFYCENIVDGPAYVRLYDDDTGKLIKDKEHDKPLEALLTSDDWTPFPPFLVTRGQRLKFDLDKIMNFPETLNPSQILALTGSDMVAVSRVWITGMYFVKGGSNRGSGQQPKRVASTGS